MDTQFTYQELSPYSVTQIYMLINDVAKYSDFIPWCTRSVVINSTATTMRAELTGKIAGFSRTITSHNQCDPHKKIIMHLSNTPVKNLQGSWVIRKLHDQNLTEITLNISYTTPTNPLYRHLKLLIDPAARKIMASFKQRARELYG